MTILNERINQAFELFDKGHLIEAEELYNRCLSEIEETDSSEYIQVLHGLGYVKASLNKFDEARSLYKELISIALSYKDKRNHCIAVHQLGMVERLAENFDQALKVFQSEMELLKEYEIESPLSISANLYEQGYVHLRLNHVDEADKIMVESLIYAKLSEDAMTLGCAYRGLGEICQTKGKFYEAKEFFYKAKEAFGKTGDPIAIKEIDTLLLGM